MNSVNYANGKVVHISSKSVDLDSDEYEYNLPSN